MKSHVHALAIEAANDAAMKCYLRHPFVGDVTTSAHKQYGGDFEGKELIKVLAPGSPGYLAMVLIEGDICCTVALKKGAVDATLPKKGLLYTS
jgi:hypothetical protein